MGYTIKANTLPTSGIASEQIMSLYDVFEPQHMKELSTRFGNQFMNAQQFLRSLGREEAVEADEWTVHEENRYHASITVGVEVDDILTTDDTVDVTLAAADHDVNGNSYPRVGDIVTIPGSLVQTIITAKDTTDPAAHVVTLTRLRASDTIGTEAGTTGLKIPADIQLPITSGAFGAGTGQPEGTNVGTTPQTFQAQIFKETVELEGTQFVNSRWYEVLDDGRPIGWYTPGTQRADYLLGLKVDGALMLGQRNDDDPIAKVASDAVNGANNTIKTTTGLIPWAKKEGKTMDISAGLDITDLNDVTIYLRQQGLDTNLVMWMLGLRQKQAVDLVAKEFLVNNGTDYTRVIKSMWGNKADTMSMSLDFEVINLSGTIFIQKIMENWSNPTTFGMESMQFDKNGIMFPLGQFMDPISHKKVKNVAIRYRAKGAYSRKYEAWDVKGAGGGRYVTDVDKAAFYLRTHLGFQVTKANQLVYLDAMTAPVYTT